MFSAREARGLIRKAVKRVPEGEEIRHLNIMPMMDMMTILLVAFIAQASASSAKLATATVTLPSSVAEQPLPEPAATLVITKTGIVVEGKAIVAVRNGDVDASQKEGGAEGRKIPRLSSFLGNLRAEQEKELRKANKPVPPVPELLVIADRSIPYGLLLSVMYSAKQPEAGYKRFRLIVRKSQLVSPPER